ncbi:hypothetical protein [Methylomonas albis]|nr:hypothetical protein [Methylomonas albis]
MAANERNAAIPLQLLKPTNIFIVRLLVHLYWYKCAIDKRRDLLQDK